MSLVIEKHKERMIKLLHALFSDVKIFLFGSFARGTDSSGSDINIALDIGKKMTLEELSWANNVLQSLNIAQKTTIIDLKNISDELKESIMEDAVEWKL